MDEIWLPLIELPEGFGLSTTYPVVRVLLTNVPEGVEDDVFFSATAPGERVTPLVIVFTKARDVIPEGKENESEEYVKGKSVFTSARLTADPEMLTFVPCGSFVLLKTV